MRSINRGMSQVSQSLSRAEKNANDFFFHVRSFQSDLSSVRDHMESIDTSHLPRRKAVPPPTATTSTA